ncbi:MAG: YciI family protein [Sphaerobacter sp.]|nr:YciI family protein [Sphaerobacter sp.]
MLMLMDDAETVTTDEEKLAIIIDAHERFTARLREAGAYVAGEGLKPTTFATTIRFTGPTPVVTDGPFAETKEYLGGFYVIDVPDLDAAIEWAKQVPYMEGGAIEIRPVIEG